LIADDYYPALERSNVRLVTTPIERVTEHGIVTQDGVERAVDAIIYGTGFRVAEPLTHVEILGAGGRNLSAAWQNGMEAYLGTVVSGFPNLYLLLGPNTGLGHNSMVFMIESQIRLVLSCMQALRERGAEVATVKPAAQARFNATLQPRLQRSVWSSGCQSWYLDANGRIPTLWPGFTFEFWLRTRRVKQRDFDFSV
jgi:cation diffusion facilitator CzcD-associated flavoprotein CzcO